MPVEVIDESAAPDAQARTAGGAPEAEPTSRGNVGESTDAPVQSALAASAEAIATAILECIGRAGAELSVALVGDDRMRELNRDWRGKDATTDVLSFSQLEGESPAGISAMHDDGSGSPAQSAMPRDESEPPGRVSAMLGDVVISVPVLEAQAADGGWTADEELARLLLHGVLHLLGFDHESDEDARAMHAEEARIVAALAARGIACAWEGGEA